MFLTIEPRGQIKIACKKCKFVTKYNVSYVEDAISDDLELTCSVCEVKFRIVIVPLNTLITQQNTQQRSAGDKCHDCDGSGFMVKNDNRRVSCSYCNGTGYV